jgi:hypothetical protein
MKKADIYKDFNGYNAYPLAEAEKIIRSRILAAFDELVGQLDGCEQKAGSMRMLWILEHITVLKRRMQRMRNQIKERDEIFIPVYLKARIARVDEKKLEKIDHRLVELIGLSLDIIGALSCAETDTRVGDKFAKISDYLREMEAGCLERALILKKEVF